MRTELAYRANGGAQIVLLWHQETNDLTVEVFDADAGDDFTLRVEPGQAMDAFHHPYAYASQRRIHYQAGTREPSHV